MAQERSVESRRSFLIRGRILAATVAITTIGGGSCILANGEQLQLNSNQALSPENISEDQRSAIIARRNLSALAAAAGIVGSIAVLATGDRLPPGWYQ